MFSFVATCLPVSSLSLWYCYGNRTVIIIIITIIIIIIKIIIFIIIVIIIILRLCLFE